MRAFACVSWAYVWSSCIRMQRAGCRWRRHRSDKRVAATVVDCNARAALEQTVRFSITAWTTRERRSWTFIRRVRVVFVCIIWRYAYAYVYMFAIRVIISIQTHGVRAFRCVNVMPLKWFYERLSGLCGNGIIPCLPATQRIGKWIRQT